MSTPYVTATEHEPLPVAHGPPEKRLSYDEAERLAAVSALRRGFCERGYRSVKLSRYSGVVGMGDRVLEILPKVDDALPANECRGILLRLLRHADALPLFRHEAAGQHLSRGSLLEVFIAAFFEAVTQIARGGLLRQYLETQDDLRVVRGAVVTARQFARHANRPDRVACRFDELTVDNPWNRRLKLGLRLVRPWVATGELFRRWAELWAIFDGVDAAAADRRALDHLVYDRHAARYRSAMEWVRWIAGVLSPSLRAGTDAAPALLFDTNALFQSAIGTVLARGAARAVEVSTRDTELALARVAGSGGRRAYRLRPDFVVRRNGAVAAIGDAKWKRLGVGQGGYLLPSESDLYQMHAYASAYDCPRLALIYPWHAGLAGSRETVLEIPRPGGATASLMVICIDVGSDVFEVLRGADAPEFGSLFQSARTPALPVG